MEKIQRIVTSSSPMRDSLVWLFNDSWIYATKSGCGTVCLVNNGGADPLLPWDWTGSSIFGTWKHHRNSKTSFGKLLRRPPLLILIYHMRLHPFWLPSLWQNKGRSPRFCDLSAEVWSLAPLQWKPDLTTPSLTCLLMCSERMTHLPSMGVYVPFWP